MTLSRILNTILNVLDLAAECFWPRPPAPHPAAIHYYETVLEERRDG